MKSEKKCATGCGRFVYHKNAKFCTICGLSYRYKMKYKKYQSISTQDLYSLILKEIEERKREIWKNKYDT